MTLKTWLGTSLLLLCCGCRSMSYTDKGVLTGGGLGAGAGALIGSATGNAGAGALIGGGLGAIAGGLTGSAIDETNQRNEIRTAQALEAQRPSLSIHDIVQMAHSHVSDHTIITQIRTTNSVYELTPNDLIYLRQQGVSDAVVAEMQTRHPRYLYRTAPPPRIYRGGYVYVEEPPPPRVSFGVGMGFGGGRGCR